MKLSFTKMQGCANDYIYLDCRKSGVPENIAALSEKLSRRHFSIGADGIICICAAQTAGADGMMRIFNADGSEGRMCGNGIRCVAEWLYTHGIAKETLAIDTLSGLKTVTHKGAGLWQVEMGAYSAMPASLPAVNMGEEPLVHRHIVQPCHAAGTPAALTCHDAVAAARARTHRDGLQQTMLCNAGRQLAQRLFVKGLARLFRVRFDLTQGQGVYLCTGLKNRGGIFKQTVQPAAKSSFSSCHSCSP